MVLEIVYITRLKIILQSNLFYVFILLSVLLYIFLNIYFDNKVSIFNKEQTNYLLYVDDYKIKDEYIKMTLCDKECLVGNYYFDDIKEIDDIKYGSRVIVKGTLDEPSNNTIPNSFNYKKYLYNKGIYYLLKIDEIIIDNSEIGFFDNIRNWIMGRILSFDSNGYIMAFIMGDKDYIDEIEYEMYQRIGVTHLFALSGMHVSVFVLLLNKLFKKLKNNIRIIMINIILFLYGYLLFFPASLMRTVCFYFINSFFKMFGINVSGFRVLILTFCILVFINYRLIYDIGFIYSFTIVGGILISNEFIKSDNVILSSLKLSVISFLFGLPITLYNFYSFNILSVLYNLFYIFLVSSIIYPFSIMVFLFPKLYLFYDYIIRFLVMITSRLSEIDFGIFYMDFNLFEVIIYYFLLIILIKFRKRFCLFLIILLFVVDIIFPYLDSNAYIYSFDVGQGDSTLVISPFRKDVVMIDIGGVRNRNVSSGIVSFLKSQGIKKIDLFIATHGDFDHIGDFKYFTKYIGVDNVKINKGFMNDLEMDMFDGYDLSSYIFKGMEVYFLDDGLIYDNENDNSIFSLFKIYDFTYLNSGDASREQELSIIEKYSLRNVDLLKVGHHGSKTSSDVEFIEVIQPRYSIISVGKSNRYGHPNDSVLQTLSDSKIFRTDMNGSVVFKINNNGFEVVTNSSYN